MKIGDKVTAVNTIDISPSRESPATVTAVIKNKDGEEICDLFVSPPDKDVNGKLICEPYVVHSIPPLATSPSTTETRYK